MCGKAAAALAKENSLGWTGGDDSLMTHKINLMYSLLKVFHHRERILFAK